MRKINCKGDFVLVLNQKVRFTESGIAIPDLAIDADKQVPLHGVVVSIGSGKSIKELDLKEQTEIYYENFQYPYIKEGDNLYHWVGHSHVLGAVAVGEMLTLDNPDQIKINLEK